MKVKSNIGCLGKIFIHLFLLGFYLVTPMQMRLFFLTQGKTIREIQNDFHKYSIFELAVDKELLRDVKDLEQIYGRIRVIARDQKIQRIIKISKKTTSFLQRPESCYIFFNQNGEAVGYHYELED
ncbi:MAG: hypothetical protein IKO40_08675 [Kiritimatiellae bacterium]|nr:hypothetical protein [Kiritimatiellia bacterium]